jgi:hypothetical protein
MAKVRLEGLQLRQQINTLPKTLLRFRHFSVPWSMTIKATKWSKQFAIQFRCSISNSRFKVNIFVKIHQTYTCAGRKCMVEQKC